MNQVIPVMGHADGLCSVYLDEHADEEKSILDGLQGKIEKGNDD